MKEHDGMMRDGSVSGPAPSRRHWSVQADIAYDRIDASLIRDDEVLFFIVTAASFIEIGSDLYTRNLVNFFAGDAEVTHWLREHWEPEEVQHGHALKGYVRRVWPEFDWEAAYQDFQTEYAKLCVAEELAPTRALELAARCMVEMGTSTYYAAIRDASNEPVLRHLAGLIRADEIRHFKYFYRFFRRYNQSEANGRLAVFGTIRRRIWELRQSDADCALWPIYRHRYQELAPCRDDEGYRRCVSDVAARVRQHYPVSMAIKMSLKPLDLPPPLQQVVQPLARVAQRWLLR